MRIMGQVCLALFLLLTAASCKTMTRTSANVVPYAIDHGLQKGGELSPVTLQHNEKLDVVIGNTRKACYFYNARVEEEPTFIREIARASRDVVHLEVIHDESVVAYLIDVSPRSDRPADCDGDTDLGARSWRVPVRAHWNLAGAGGFVAHDLVNPEFYMTPAERPKGSGTEQGFMIHRQAENEDDHTVAATAMMHLWRSDIGFYGINWSPLSFGLGVDDKRTDYLVGTSLRFGNRVYITFGRIFGNVTRLKSGTVLDQFTTDANALSGLPTRRDESWFVSASFGFINAGISNLFKSKVGIPAVPPTTPAQPPTTPVAELKIVADPTTGAAGASIKVKPTSGKFGAAAATSSITLKDSAGFTVTHPSETLGTNWTTDEIKITVPANSAAGAVTIEVMVAGKKATTTYTIPSPPPPVIVAVPPVGPLNADITLTAPASVVFGSAAELSKLVLKPATGAEKTIKSTDLAAKWKTGEITFQVPTGVAAGKVAIQVVVNGKIVATSEYTVQ